MLNIKSRVQYELGFLVIDPNYNDFQLDETCCKITYHGKKESLMSKAKIEAGNCGFLTDVEAIAKENYAIELSILSECKHIQKLAENIKEVNAINEISFRKSMPEILQKGAEFCTHAACPVPVGIIKAVEVAAGFAIPQEIKIIIEK